jgi:hypothetical protein
MASGPLHLDPKRRQLLAEFERRYACWCLANASAEAAERELARKVREHEQGNGPAPPGEEVQQVLDLHAQARRLQQEAVQLLRDAPI